MTGLNSLAALEGVWELDRLITHSDGSSAHMKGTATFSRSGHRLIHDEAGMLDTSDGRPPLRATRRYVWIEDGNRLECLFADGQPFHTVPMDIENPETTYLCTPDRYQVRYDFTGWPVWVSEWKVTGPKKDYVMRSTFTRA